MGLQAKRVKRENKQHVYNLINHGLFVLSRQNTIKMSDFEYSIANELVLHAAIITKDVQQSLQTQKESFYCS